jgi:hypothetical protein
MKGWSTKPGRVLEGLLHFVSMHGGSVGSRLRFDHTRLMILSLRAETLRRPLPRRCARLLETMLPWSQSKRRTFRAIPVHLRKCDLFERQRSQLPQTPTGQRPPERLAYGVLGGSSGQSHLDPKVERNRRALPGCPWLAREALDRLRYPWRASSAENPWVLNPQRVNRRRSIRSSPQPPFAVALGSAFS